MPKQLTSLYPYLILLLLGIIWMYMGLGKMIFHPNQHMLDTGVDGLKNYTNTMYYVRHDSGFHYSGMNYPYGEHITFTDNQPLFALLLNAWDDHVFPIADQIPGIFNILMLGSFVAGMLLMYYLARYFQLPKWYAIILAFLIGAMAPQWQRVHGHFALSYAFLVPVAWILLLHSQPHKSRHGVYVGLLILYGCLMSLIHVYYAMILAVFVMAFYVVKALQERHTRKTWIRHIVYGLVIAITPLIAFKLFLWITDPITDRPSNPYGFFDHQTIWEGVFLASEGPLWSFWNQFVKVQRTKDEGYAYVGWVAALVALFTLFKWGKSLRRRKAARMFTATHQKEMRTSFWAAFLVLLFSMGVPFNQLPFLLELLSPLKQFRSLGRFAWVFYYVFTLYAGIYVYLLFRMFKMRRMYSMAYWVLSLMLLLWLAEGWILIKHRNDRFKAYGTPNLLQQPRLDYIDWLEAHGYQPADFQAIMAVPAYFIGSEKFSPPINFFSYRESITASWQTGLPMVCGLLSRTSLTQSLKLVQLTSSHHIEKEILSDFPNSKPLLLIVAEDEPATAHELALAAKAQLLSRRENISLYKLPLSAFESNRSMITRSYEQLRQDSSVVAHEDLLMRQDTFVHINYFADDPPTAFAEKTHYSKSSIVLYDAPIPQPGTYTLSCWIRVTHHKSGFPVLLVQEYNAENQLIHTYEMNPKFQTEVYQDFARAELTFNVTEPSHRFVCHMSGEYIEVASVLLQPTGTEVFLPLAEGDGFMYNNYYYE